MQRLYLLRHAEPGFSTGGRFCLGQRSDPPISAEAAAGATTLPRLFAVREIRAVGTSPLLRCRQTAQLLFPGVEATLLPGMLEQDCGLWDGLSFDEIRAKYPADYARRGENPALPPPGGERPEAAAARGLAALREFLSRTEGDAAVIGHAGINRAMLCTLLKKPFSELYQISQPYLGVNLLCFDGGEFRVEAVGQDAFDFLEGSDSHQKTV